MGWWLPAGYEDYVPGAGGNFVCRRYCPVCAISHRETSEVPCWNCGGEMTTIIPKYWPDGGAGENVTGGRSYSVWEMAASEDVVALILEGFPE